MKCPYCGAEESKVIDSRPTEDSERIRRRRECLSCHMRFTTYEVVETVPLVVIKKDSSREPFDRQKLLNAMVRACAKRPVSYESLERAVSSIEQTLLSSYDREIPSVRIGELTMQELKKIDEVAYVRFASVYRQFADVESFFNELQKLMGDHRNNRIDPMSTETVSEQAQFRCFCHTSRWESHSSVSTCTCARRSSPKASSGAFISRWPSAARRAASSSVKSAVRSR